MKNFYFLAAYDHSPVGFQLARLANGSSEAELIEQGNIESPEITTVMGNSGALCACGKSESTGLYYAVFRKLSAVGKGGDRFSLSIALEADETERDLFLSFVKRALLQQSDFLTCLGSCLDKTCEGALSYSVDGGGLRNALSEPFTPAELHEKEHLCQGELCALLSAIENGDVPGLLLLVPEATVDYFYEHNASFNGVAARHIIEAKALKAQPDKRASGSCGEKAASESVTSSDGLSGSQEVIDLIKELLEENSETVKTVAAVMLGVGVAVGLAIGIASVRKNYRRKK